MAIHNILLLIRVKLPHPTQRTNVGDLRSSTPSFIAKTEIAPPNTEDECWRPPLFYSQFYSKNISEDNIAEKVQYTYSRSLVEQRVCNPFYQSQHMLQNVKARQVKMPKLLNKGLQDSLQPGL
ncbi:hypothetical protein QE152_g11448 [Popillia japonica]|uniref:Uncharacterized protein n=1 Tax=Popillia japonica TaxID=7064 RepID=A0AAW1LRL1_POPJA